MTEPPVERSALAIALEWSSTVISISIAMVVPGLVGYWIDARLGTGFLFLVAGMALGVTVGIWQLIRLTEIKQAQSKQPPNSSRDEPREP